MELAFEIAYILSYGLVDFRYISAIIDSSYVVLFGMQHVDIEGFRRMRSFGDWKEDKRHGVGRASIDGEEMKKGEWPDGKARKGRNEKKGLRDTHY